MRFGTLPLAFKITDKMSERVISKSLFSDRFAYSAPVRRSGAGNDVVATRTYSSTVVGHIQNGSYTRAAQGNSKVKYKVIASMRRHGVYDRVADLENSGACAVYSEAHVAMLREHSVRSTDFVPTTNSSFDLMAVCRRLGQFVARATSGLGDTPVEWLLGGNALEVGELPSSGALFGNPGVYMPMKQGNDPSESLLGVILYASRGCGVDVYTDSVYAKGGSWNVNIPRGGAAIQACYRAVQLIVDSAEYSGAGALHAVAFIFGLHDIYSVEAHTDEGGAMRDILRRTHFSRPRGMIGGKPVQRFVMPMPARGGRTTAAYRGGVDSMLLTSAALFAVSDLGTGESGSIPTVSWIGEGVGWHAHEGRVTTIARDLIFTWFGKFASASKLVPNLGETLAAACVGGVRRVFSGVENRHLSHPGVYLAYWVEPSPLLCHASAEVKDNTVCTVHSGTMTDPTVYEMFGPNAEYYPKRSHHAFSVHWTQAPRDWGSSYIYSPNANRIDGFAAMTVTASNGEMGRTLRGYRQAKPSLMCPGSEIEPGDQSLASLFWTVDSSGIYPPHMCNVAEFTPVVNIHYERGDDFSADADQVMTCHLPRANDKVAVWCTEIRPDTCQTGRGSRRDFSGNRGIRRAAMLASKMDMTMSIDGATEDEMLDRWGPHVRHADGGDLHEGDLDAGAPPEDDPGDGGDAPPGPEGTVADPPTSMRPPGAPSGARGRQVNTAEAAAAPGVVTELGAAEEVRTPAGVPGLVTGDSDGMAAILECSDDFLGVNIPEIMEGDAPAFDAFPLAEGLLKVDEAIEKEGKHSPRATIAMNVFKAQTEAAAAESGETVRQVRSIAAHTARLRDAAAAQRLSSLRRG